ncbi:ABC transporter permease [Puia sp. P3]|uniref:ABC transporter permease n=1 Tax=Puia sp. P3 TaxID=3423952 RepID=UPI003D6659BD
MSRFNTVETLKGRLGLKRKSGVRSSLIVAQFVIACVMICCTFVVYLQGRHLQDADLGMDKSFLVSIPLRAPEKGRETVEKLRMMLASDPRVLSVSGSNINMGRGADRKTVSISTGFDYKGKSVSTDRAWIDYDYLKTLGIPLVAGREFDKSYGTDTADNVLLSESMAKQLHEKDVVGKTIIPDGETKGMHVVGVFADFHLYSMAQQIRPLTLSFAKGGSTIVLSRRRRPGRSG